ncbi:DinB family protein [Aureivirga sp. CE67]|uniref:DinB family protein n=1 Tax=Aureivirga sp. CE67 TaxID=1788983 RepID=UPI0018C97666|nr:DinB family protein [Aureivirga sp. CE67]
MKEAFDVLQRTRETFLKVIEGLSIEELNTIPKGFKNNIVWNMNHLTVTQQLLCHKLSGEPCLVDDEFIELYRKGTHPVHKIDLELFEEQKKLFLEIPLKTKELYEKGHFKNYHTYMTSANVELDSFEKALQFNNFHEGIHFGSILALKKVI